MIEIRIVIDESRHHVGIKSSPNFSSTQTERAIASRFEEQLKAQMVRTIETMPAPKGVTRG